MSTAVPAEVPEDTAQEAHEGCEGPSVLPFARGDCHPAASVYPGPAAYTGFCREMCAQSDVLMGGLGSNNVPLCSVPLTLEADL